MKKLFLAAAFLGFVAVGFTSCSTDYCVECAGVATVCEDNYPSGSGMSWKTYSDNLLLNPSCKKVKQ